MKVERDKPEPNDLMLKKAYGYTRDHSEAIDDAAPILPPAAVAEFDARSRQKQAERRGQDDAARREDDKRQEAAEVLDRRVQGAG